MKRLFLLILLIASVNCVIAEEINSGGIWYDINEDTKEAEVIKYKNSNYKYVGSITIAENINHDGTDYSVTSIREFAFYYCNRLKTVTIPKTVRTIGYSAFHECTSLESVIIPNTILTIENSVFYNCQALTSITIPNSVTSIGEWAFQGCSSLKSVTIPNSVTSIGASAFYGCTGLTSITIPNSVTSIEGGTFLLCIKLSSVTIPYGITSIEAGSFRDCIRLSVIDIPNSVASIGDYAFYGCNLASVKIPASVTSIGLGAFQNCNLLIDVISMIKNPFEIDKNTFSENTFNNATLYVPKGTIDKYKAKKGWKMFIDIEENNTDEEDNVTEVKAMPVLIQAEGNIISVQGAAEGTDISVYNTAGIMLNSAIANNGITTLNTTLPSGSTAIVKIGEKSVKLLVK